MKNKIKYVIISVVLLIPFIYSFFYLKAYWNPYGEGNIDNIPVAIVNLDKGDKGDSLIKSIRESKKLKLSELSSSEASDGLYDGKYYAVINIPESFSSDLKSASSTKKTHATITYSPNQKANYLASQIINSVVNAVEKNLDNEVNSAIVKELSDNLNSSTRKIDVISDGFGTLKEGTSKLSVGSNKLKSGANTLNSSYNKFNNGIYNINSGVSTLNNGSLELSNGIKKAYDGSSQIKNALDSKIEELKNDSSPAISDEELNQIGISARKTAETQEAIIKNTALTAIRQDETYKQISDAINLIESNYINNGITDVNACQVLSDESSINICQNYVAKYTTLIEEKSLMENVAQNVAYITALNTTESASKQTAANVANKAKQAATDSSIKSLSELSYNIGTLNEGLSNLYNGSLELSSGVHTLFNGTNRLYSSSLELMNGINTLSNGVSTLNSGINTLDNSVFEGKKELDSNIDNAKKSVKKLNGLSDYSKSPIKVKTKEVNKVNSYGTSFSPFFISIGLWVGSLMMLIVFYYDKEERFKLLGMESKQKVKQILAYHGLITISSLVLGMLLHLFLDFEITNIFLYYLSLVLVGNAFMAIILFLIICFNDIGKFIALILLVLQLAASGGTFPVETVSKEFRWLHKLLPMTYSVDLLRESLIKIQGKLLANNIIVIILIFIIFATINIIIAKNKEKQY